MAASSYDQAFFVEDVEFALEDLVRASGLSPQEIVGLVEYGVFHLAQGSASGTREVSSWRFSARYVALGRRASRLKADFGLDVSGLALALTYIERIEEMEAELARLRCHLVRGS